MTQDNASPPAVRLGLKENLGQFSLLMLVNAFVGGMVGLERTVVPLVGSEEFGLVLRTAIFSFIVTFGLVKALYRAGHVPGALSVPVSSLEAALQVLPKDKEIVAYCRGPYCVFSDEAVALLKARGYRASRLTEGFPEWRAAGLPVEH